MSTEVTIEGVVEQLMASVDRSLVLKCEIRVGNDDEGILTGEFEGPGVARLLDNSGELLDAVQVVATQAVRRIERDQSVVIDAGGYRARHRAALQRLAARAAEEAIATGDEIELDPMNPHDRRIVHLALQDVPSVVTRSEGQEPRRRIIVEPADSE